MELAKTNDETEESKTKLKYFSNILKERIFWGFQSVG
jgi:hypothetical protein